MSELEKLRKEVVELRGRVRELEEKEKALLESARRHRIITELISDRVCTLIVNPDGTVTMGDPILGVIGPITGYTLEEIREPDQWKKVVHPDDWPEVERGIKSLFEGKRDEIEIRVISKKGEITWHQITGIPDWDEENNRLKGAFWCIRDIGAQKRAEEEMLRLERLRALGQMAAGISHNLNNILTTILGPARLLEREIRDPALRQETEYIIRSARRARDLVKRMNEAVRGRQDEGVRGISVNKAVEEAIELTRSAWKDEPESRGVEIAMRVELGEVPEVLGTSSGMLDVVVNLLLNAVDALPEGGEIVIRTDSVGDGVVLTVRDSGLGMDERTRRQIFEPFFTTKSEIGTGLGLSTVYGTVTRWGGTIDVLSSVGAGSEFMIRLPAHRGEETKPEDAAVRMEARRGRVLVVEDVESIRSFLSRVLAPEHEVKAFAGGEEVLRGFEAGAFDAAIIDLGLSEIPGDRVGRLLRQTDPALATILISGWDLAADDPRAKGFDFRIGKPFDDLKEVRRVVAGAIVLHDERAKRER